MKIINHGCKLSWHVYKNHWLTQRPSITHTNSSTYKSYWYVKTWSMWKAYWTVSWFSSLTLLFKTFRAEGFTLIAKGYFCEMSYQNNQQHVCESAILNLDDSNGDGTHWVAWCKMNIEKFYFDSYGLSNQLLEYLIILFITLAIEYNQIIACFEVIRTFIY